MQQFECLLPRELSIEVLMAAKCSEFLPALRSAGVKSARELDKLFAPRDTRGPRGHLVAAMRRACARSPAAHCRESVSKATKPSLISTSSQTKSLWKTGS